MVPSGKNGVSRIGERHTISRPTTTKRLDSPCDCRCKATLANNRCEVEAADIDADRLELDVVLIPDRARDRGALGRGLDVLVGKIGLVHLGMDNDTQ